MKATCLSNSSSALPAEHNAPAGRTAETYPVMPGNSYAVYALTLFQGTVWYYIRDDDALTWPVWKPSALFQVQDGSLPAGWIYGYHRNDQGDGDTVLLSCPEWANDPYYYERLVDGDQEAVACFERWKMRLQDIPRHRAPKA